MARVLVFDTEAQEFHEAECEALDDFYRELKCDTFDIARRQVGSRAFDIFVDDKGALKDDPIVSAVNHEGEPMLVGNLVFANHDGAGETTSLSDEDIECVKRHLVQGWMLDGGERKFVLCEY